MKVKKERPEVANKIKTAKSGEYCIMTTSQQILNPDVIK